MDLTESQLSILFDLWNRLPVVKILDDDTYEKILKQNFRESICQILSTGIPDHDPRTYRSTKRHVLSAKEIRIALEKSLKMSIKYPGLYFHLSKLEEYDLIQIPIKIKKKKNNVSYYSLTAQNFSHETDWLAYQKTPMTESESDIIDMIISYFYSNNLISDTNLLVKSLEELEDLNQDKPSGFDAWIKSLKLGSDIPKGILLFLLDIYQYKYDKTVHIRELIRQLEKLG